TTIRSSSIKIGTAGSEVNNFFNGTIDEVLVYDRALNASEITALDTNAPLVQPRSVEIGAVGGMATNGSPSSEFSVASPNLRSNDSYRASEVTDPVGTCADAAKI